LCLCFGNRVRAGDRATFDALCSRWCGPLVVFLRKKGARGQEAEDLAQDTWEELLRRCQCFRGNTENEFEAWLFERAGKRLLSKRRTESRRRSLLDNVLRQGRPPGVSSLSEEELSVLLADLRALRDKGRFMGRDVEALIGRLEGRAEDDAARTIGFSTPEEVDKAVKQAWRRYRKLIREA